MMSSNFWKIKTSNLNSNPGFFNLIKLRPILPATYFFNTFKTGKSPTTETNVFLWKTFRKVFNILVLRPTNIERSR